ncbi:hypothetical protein F5Y01DRAFT_320331 [Xylaria sp. FL0043]|nr:hypothetical protein F5Y01DRAFT_320331 [Xylaria sp. FL0043]
MIITPYAHALAVSALSRIGTYFHEKSTLAPVTYVLGEWHNISLTEYRRYDGLGRRRDPIISQTTLPTVEQTPRMTRTITSSTSSTITITITRASTSTSTTSSSPSSSSSSNSVDTNTSAPTSYVKESVTGAHGQPTFASQEECDWLAISTISKRLKPPYKLLSESEVKALSDALSQAQESNRTLAPIAATSPRRQAAHANALGGALDYLVSEPLRNSCHAVINLQRELALVTRGNGNDTRLSAFFDTALATVFDTGLHTPSAIQPGTMPKGTKKIVEVVRAKAWGNARYCLADDCEWPARIYDMWRDSVRLREELRARLVEGKARVLDPAALGGRSLRSVLIEMGVLVTLYIVCRVAYRVLSRRPTPRVNG